MITRGRKSGSSETASLEGPSGGVHEEKDTKRGLKDDTRRTSRESTSQVRSSLMPGRSNYFDKCWTKCRVGEPALLHNSLLCYLRYLALFTISDRMCSPPSPETGRGEPMTKLLGPSAPKFLTGSWIKNRQNVHMNQVARRTSLTLRNREGKSEAQLRKSGESDQPASPRLPSGVSTHARSSLPVHSRSSPKCANVTRRARIQFQMS